MQQLVKINGLAQCGSALKNKLIEPTVKLVCQRELFELWIHLVDIRVNYRHNVRIVRRYNFLEQLVNPTINRLPIQYYTNF